MTKEAVRTVERPAGAEVRAPRKRDLGVDLAKAVSILGVIMVHISSQGYNFPLGSFNWSAAVFWGSVVRGSVPIFFMCSGVLFLDPERELPLRKLYGRYLLRIAAAMLFWAMAYKTYHLLADGNLTPASLWQAVKEVLVFKQEFHLYFLHIILLFYAASPVMRVFVRNADRKTLRYALALWFVLGILYPTLRPFRPVSLVSGSAAQWLINQCWAAQGYALLGWYIHRYGISVKLSTALTVGGFAFIFGGTVIMSLRRGELFQNFGEGMSLGPAMLSAGVFGLFLAAGKKLRGRAASAVTWLSKASFCVYLVHVFVIYAVIHFGVYAYSFTPALSIPLIALGNLAVSLAVYFVLSKIPIVRRWII